VDDRLSELRQGVVEALEVNLAVVDLAPVGDEIRR
jgi:hypothetical protein